MFIRVVIGCLILAAARPAAAGERWDKFKAKLAPAGQEAQDALAYSWGDGIGQRMAREAAYQEVLRLRKEAADLRAEIAALKAALAAKK